MITDHMLPMVFSFFGSGACLALVALVPATGNLLWLFAVIPGLFLLMLGWYLGTLLIGHVFRGGYR